MKCPARTILQELKDGTFVVQCLSKDEKKVTTCCTKISNSLNCVIKIKAS